MNKVLHLVLTGEWYDKIESGKKTKEYRAPTKYWDRRLTPIWNDLSFLTENTDNTWTVVFHRGYTNKTMEFEIDDIGITEQPNDLKLPKCWEISLGKRVRIFRGHCKQNQ